MSRIILLGDVHDERERLAASLALATPEGADLALLPGDLGLDPPWSEPARRAGRERHDDSVRRVLATIGETLGCPVVFVPGNHDLPDPPADLPAVNADGRVVSAAGLTIAGLGGAGPARFGFAYEWSETDAARRLQRLLPQGAPPVDVLLSHTPPAGSPLDRTARGVHVGSRAVAEAIARARPALFVCGHIHEAWGLETLHGAPSINAGSLGDPHGRVIAWRVDWDGGPRRVRSLVGRKAAPVEVREWPLSPRPA